MIKIQRRRTPDNMQILAIDTRLCMQYMINPAILIGQNPIFISNAEQFDARHFLKRMESAFSREVAEQLAKETIEITDWVDPIPGIEIIITRTGSRYQAKLNGTMIASSQGYHQAVQNATKAIVKMRKMLGFHHDWPVKINDKTEIEA